MVPRVMVGTGLLVAGLAACQAPLADAGTRTMAAASPGGVPLAASPGPAAAAPTLSPEQARFTVAVGETFRLVVKGIPTTGYVWHLMPGHDAAVVTARGNRTLEPAPGDPPLLGAPTAEVFEFTAARSGRTTLVLKLYRPWEGEASTIETRRAEVVVS